jgi:hypothetical protein
MRGPAFLPGVGAVGVTSLPKQRAFPNGEVGSGRPKWQDATGFPRPLHRIR